MAQTIWTAARRRNRRDALKLGGLAAFAAALPVGARLAVAAPARASTTGYWHGGAALDGFERIQAGWDAHAARACTPCEAPLHDGIVAASHVAARGGKLKLRILGAEGTTTARVEAALGGQRHVVWERQAVQGRLQTTSPLALHWRADAGESMSLWVHDGAHEMALAVPATPGVYVLPLTASTSSWSRFALRAADPAMPLSRRLVARDGSAAPACLLVAVQDASVREA